MIALTFDDGPDPRGTPAVLDALARAGAHATFFVLGERASAHPELLERVLGDGHRVEVHGHAHLRHPQAGRDAVARDLDAALEVLGTFGVHPRLWRVPWGDCAGWSLELAAERGLTLTGWTADTRDWDGAPAATLLVRVAAALHPGAVVLAHDGVGPGARRSDCAATAALVAPLVAATSARGLGLAALDPDWAAGVPDGNPELAAVA